MRNLKVLVADDNPINQRHMVALLKSQGHTGVVVNDGDKVLRCLAQLRFDLVLLDVQMPVLDGLQALAEIRARERAGAARVPVILVTANDLPGDRIRFLQLGADGYVTKPVDPAALQQEMGRVLGFV
jgi:CheY-like chemotaxis protein